MNTAEALKKLHDAQQLKGHSRRTMVSYSSVFIGSRVLK